MKKKNRKGEIFTNKDGLKLKIVEYFGCNDMTVELETGELVYHVRYANFRRGWVFPKNRVSKRLSKIAHNKYNERMKIISYNHSMDITVQFDDGTIKENQTYFDFINGNILNKTGHLTHMQNKRNEQCKINNDGQLMQIIAYRGCHDVDVKVAGVIYEKCRYNQFMRGTIGTKGFLVGRKSQGVL